MKFNLPIWFFPIFSFGLLFLGYLVRLNSWYVPYNYAELNRENFISDLKKQKFSLKDRTLELGITFNYNPPKIDPVAYYRVDSLVQAPGILVADIDNNGFQDFMVISAVKENPSQVYLNSGSDSFNESSYALGLSELTNDKLAAIHGQFIDVDNDQLLDLYVVGLGCARFFKNKNGKFVDETQSSGLGDCLNAQAITAMDYNQDGFQDIYVLRYWRDYDLMKLSDPYIYVDNLNNAKNGGRNSLYVNQGDGTFKDNAKELGVDDEHWSYDSVYIDLNNDGVRELYISNDYGADVIYTQKEKFENISSSSFDAPDRRYSMNVSLVDIGDVKPAVYVSNFFEGVGYSLFGNFMWQMNQAGKMKDRSRDFGVFDCGMAWGAAHGDLNLDGTEDLYVTNGFAAKRRHYLEDAHKNRYKNVVLMERSPNDDKESFYYEWFVRSLPGALTQDITRWGSLIHRGSRNDQTDCLFMNDKNDFFHNVSSTQPAIEIWNGKAAVTIDHDNNGVLDLIVTTNNGPVHYLSNQVKPSNNWIGLNLKSKFANSSTITITQENAKFFRWNTLGRHGLISQSDSRVHVGLKSDKPVEVEIKWGNGKVQKISNLNTGKYYDVVEESIRRF